jgi:hypothetical protein
LDNIREPHTFEFAYEEPFMDPDYKNIVIIRNPYDRILSGYYDKYVDGHLTPDIGELTFEEFINSFPNDKIDFDHFSLQFSRAYNENIIFDKIYDIDHFDVHDFINQFTLKKREYNNDQYISRSFYKNDHTNEFRKNIYLYNAYKTPYNELCIIKQNKFVPYYNCFYNQDLLKKVYNLYEYDFICLQKLGLKFFNCKCI